MISVSIGRFRITSIVERSGPTRPTWLLPDATLETLERHRAWLAPHFLDEKGRFLQSVHTFVVRGPGLTVLVDTGIGNGKDRGGGPFPMLETGFLEDGHRHRQREGSRRTGAVSHARDRLPRGPSAGRRAAGVGGPGHLHASTRRPR